MCVYHFLTGFQHNCKPNNFHIKTEYIIKYESIVMHFNNARHAALKPTSSVLIENKLIKNTSQQNKLEIFILLESIY